MVNVAAVEYPARHCPNAVRAVDSSEQADSREHAESRVEHAHKAQCQVQDLSLHCTRSEGKRCPLFSPLPSSSNRGLAASAAAAAARKRASSLKGTPGWTPSKSRRLAWRKMRARTHLWCRGDADDTQGTRLVECSSYAEGVGSTQKGAGTHRSTQEERHELVAMHCVRAAGRSLHCPVEDIWDWLLPDRIKTEGQQLVGVRTARA